MDKYGYKNLIVWQKSMKLVTEIYLITKLFPKEEIFALTSQVRRAAVSIPSNIAEGSSRKTINDYKHFMTMARGSLLELETQIEISYNLKYINNETTETLYVYTTELNRILNKLSLD